MIKSQIEQAKGDVAALERLYEQAIAAEEEGAFKEAIAECAEKYPEDILFSAWVYRLNVQPVQTTTGTKGKVTRYMGSKQWGVAIGASVILGILYVVFAGDKPPMPIPSQANSLFWIGWGPLTALAILFYLAIVDNRKERFRWYAISALIVAFATIFTIPFAWGRADAVANLIALHLPFVAWAAVGGSVAFGYSDAARQFFGVMVKSVETVLTAGIYLIAGIIFAGLTYGIFAALGINFSEPFLRTVAAWGFGAIPILALISVYDALSSPAEQSWTTGLARILRILTRLLLPLAIGVLTIYVFWFIPAYFWRPFREREVLIVYNATIIGVIALLVCAVPGWEEKRSLKYDLILRYAILSTGVLTLLLNIYALAAIASRTFTGGLTPNRHAVLGWNVATLLMLGVVTIRLLQSKSDKWADVFRDSMAQVLVLAISWSLWVLFGLPHF